MLDSFKNQEEFPDPKNSAILYLTDDDHNMYIQHAEYYKKMFLDAYVAAS